MIARLPERDRADVIPLGQQGDNAATYETFAQMAIAVTVQFPAYPNASIPNANQAVAENG
jgi:hypothetical protein